jgi:hypothetical protein
MEPSTLYSPRQEFYSFPSFLEEKDLTLLARNSGILSPFPENSFLSPFPITRRRNLPLRSPKLGLSSF